VLTTPAEVGAVSVPVCRLSGMRAAGECAQLTEWFVPGTEPSREDDWERSGVVQLPDEYAEWVQQGLRPTGDEVRRAFAAARSVPSRRGGSRPAGQEAELVVDARATQFRIISPLDGDRYTVPAGVEARYASIALRAGGTGAEHVRWSVDGKPYVRDRWSPTSGTHEIRAVSARGDTAQVRIVVEP
jgi:hypothetical protein